MRFGQLSTERSAAFAVGHPEKREDLTVTTIIEPASLAAYFALPDWITEDWLLAAAAYLAQPRLKLEAAEQDDPDVKS